MSSYSWSSPQEKREWMLDFCNIKQWHDAGVKGKGITILNHENNTDHAEMTNEVIKLVAPEATLINANVKSAYMDGELTFYNFVIDEVTYTLEEMYEKFKPDIMTVSFSGGGSIQKEQEKRLLPLIEKGLNIFNSASNDGDKGTDGKYENIAILVGAVYPYKNEDGVKLTYYSSYNETCDQPDDVDFVAFMGNGSGTSASSPFQAGMGALLMNVFGKTLQDKTLELMKRYSKDVGKEGKDNKHGYGITILPDINLVLEDEEMKFTDVDSNHWANLAIEKAVKKEIFKGYEDGTFKPDENMTRAQMCVVLDRLGLLD